MKTITHRVRDLVSGRRILVCVSLALLIALVVACTALGDVYWNVGPAPQVPAGGWYGRYPLTSYGLDEYFPGIKAGVLSGVDVSGVPPLIAYMLAQVIWQLTVFISNTVITLFAFAFSLDLVGGSSGALGPVTTAIHNIYNSTFGEPWLIAAISLTGGWAMWRALVQRRYTETAGALGISLLYCILALGIVTYPERTIAPASALSNEVSGAILSLTSRGTVTSGGQAKSAASNELFQTLVVDPWTVLEFGGLEHCVTSTGRPTLVRPLSTSPSEDQALGRALDSASGVRAQGKTCINDRNKYAEHFLGYTPESPGRKSEYEALKAGDTTKLPSSDLAKRTGSYTLGAVDKPAVEAMGKGGQYERLLLALVILLGEAGAWLLLGGLAAGILLAQALLLFRLALVVVALIAGVVPGRGHEFFRSWMARLGALLLRKVVYSLILALVLVVCQALQDSTSGLGWLMSFALETGFLWAVFTHRHQIAGDFLAAAVGPAGRREATARLQSFYHAAGLTRMARRRPRRQPPPGNTEVNVHYPPLTPPDEEAPLNPDPATETDTPEGSA